MSKIYFRADGNSQIGLGHIFRSLALATMLKNDFECIFVIRNPLDTLKPKIQAVANLIELPEPTDELEEATHLVNSYLSEQDIVVLDGYHFKTSYQEVIKTAGVKLVSIDDIYECHFLSDAIINHAGGITPDYYNNQFYTQFYLGLNYLLLRPVFLEAAQTPYTKTDTNNIFICMGGADTNNNTIDILHKIEQKWTADDITCYVVIGQAYLHKKELENVIADSSLTIKVLSNLSAEQMLYYMQLCPIAICPPSGITFEYLCTAGALYLYQIADNQKDVKKHLLKENLAFDFKSQFPVDPTTIKSVIERQKIMIDGQSPSRLLTFFRSLEQEASLSIEKATDQHLMQYFDWANDPSVRQNAFNSDSIPLENHTKWFSKKIVENNALLLYFHDNNKPIGQVRLELNENNHAQIDYSVDSKQHSKGYGTTILKLALLYAVEHQFCSKFFGDVKSTNIASRKIFQKLAFAESFNTEKDYYTYELEIPAHA